MTEPIKSIVRMVISDLKRKYKISDSIRLTPEMREIAERFNVKEELKKAKESQKKNGE